MIGEMIGGVRMDLDQSGCGRTRSIQVGVRRGAVGVLLSDTNVGTPAIAALTMSLFRVSARLDENLWQSTLPPSSATGRSSSPPSQS
jgi:hypothetical protein